MPLPTNSGILKPDNELTEDKPHYLELKRPLRFLSPKEICMIDDFLSAMKAQGELRLVVQKGRLRFVTETKDFNVGGSEEGKGGP
jgi:hypothetical protein